ECFKEFEIWLRLSNPDLVKEIEEGQWTTSDIYKVKDFIVDELLFNRFHYKQELEDTYGIKISHTNQSTKFAKNQRINKSYIILQYKKWYFKLPGSLKEDHNDFLFWNDLHEVEEYTKVIKGY